MLNIIANIITDVLVAPFRLVNSAYMTISPTYDRKRIDIATVHASEELDDFDLKYGHLLDGAKLILDRYNIELNIVEHVEMQQSYNSTMTCSLRGFFTEQSREYNKYASKRDDNVIVLNFVDGINPKGTIGCAFPTTQWALIDSPDPATIVHEIAHLCGILRHSKTPHNIMAPKWLGKRTELTNWQLARIKTSRFCV